MTISPEPTRTMNCPKAPHIGIGYLHGENDDTPYHVDGVKYCGRCHHAWPCGSPEPTREEAVEMAREFVDDTRAGPIHGTEIDLICRALIAANADGAALRHSLAVAMAERDDARLMLRGVRNRRFDIWDDEDLATVGHMNADEWCVEHRITEFVDDLPVLTDSARAALGGGK